MFYIVSHIPIVTLISPGDLDAMKYKSNSIENEELEHLHWSMNDKGDNILYNANIIECKRAIEGEDNFSMIFTNQPIPKVVDHFYFEVTVEDEAALTLALANSSQQIIARGLPGPRIVYGGFATLALKSSQKAKQ